MAIGAVIGAGVVRIGGGATADFEAALAGACLMTAGGFAPHFS